MALLVGGGQRGIICRGGESGEEEHRVSTTEASVYLAYNGPAIDMCWKNKQMNEPRCSHQNIRMLTVIEYASF